MTLSLDSLLPKELFVYIPTISLFWVISLVIYRRFLHPLASIPGPFLAAVTDLYVLKFNVFSRRSQLYLQIEKLHAEYGTLTASANFAVPLAFD